MKFAITIDDKSYAIDSSSIVEIIPLVQLHNAKQQNSAIAGEMNYRGNVLPVIDLCMLFSNRPHQKKFSTRILVIQLEDRMAGLIAERLTDLSPVEAKDSQNLDLNTLVTQCL